MFMLKPTPNLWLSNGIVPWDPTMVIQQLMAFQRDNVASDWAKPWVLVPWCRLLVNALHYTRIVVICCCFRGQKIVVRGHNGPHLWKRELKSWLEKPNECLDSINVWWKCFELNIFILLCLWWWLHHHILGVMKKGQTLVLALRQGTWLMPPPLYSSSSPCQHQVVLLWWRGRPQSLIIGHSN